MKPSYSPPLMVAVRKMPLNGYTVISTFSGAGGSSLGLRMAGFKCLWANEFVQAAQEVYRQNFPDTFLNPNDIRTITSEDIYRETGAKKGSIDLMEGSPPCSSFSTAGQKEKNWGKEKKYSTDKVQRTDDLFFEYTRLLRSIKPKMFVAENVSGLVKGVSIGYFKEIMQEFENAGYKVRAQLLDAAWLGVPQKRQRLIFLGARDDLGVEPEYPKPLPYQ